MEVGVDGGIFSLPVPYTRLDRSHRYPCGRVRTPGPLPGQCPMTRLRFSRRCPPGMDGKTRGSGGRQYWAAAVKAFLRPGRNRSTACGNFPPEFLDLSGPARMERLSSRPVTHSKKPKPLPTLTGAWILCPSPGVNCRPWRWIGWIPIAPGVYSPW